jgi:hypothetical protein
MNIPYRVRRALGASVLVLFIAGLAACGGGGGGSSTPAATSPPPAATPPPASDPTPEVPPPVVAPTGTTGTVGIFMTDGPTDDYDGVLITVLSILLLGEDGQEEIWSGEETFDLLDLEHYADLFAINDEVPVGTYDKIRLRVKDVTLVRGEDDDPELIPVKLPANGKIDLNPRGTFEVEADGLLLLKIDIDAKRSIHVVETGKGGFRFRPVVFVDVLGIAELDKLIRVHGVVRDLERDDGDFELCELDIVVDPRIDDDDFDEEQCVDVEADEDTGFFSGQDGTEITLDQLSEGDEATVIGFLGIEREDDDDDEDGDDGDEGDDEDEKESPFFVHAEVVEAGPLGSFLMLTGTAKDSVDENNDFPMVVDPGQGYEEGYTPTVETSDGTKVFSPENEPLTVADIEVDDRVTADGVFGTGDIYRSSLIILDKSEKEGEKEVIYDGLIADTDDNSRTFQLTTDDVEGGTACIFVPEDADIIIEPAEDDGPYTEGDFADITVGRGATVFGIASEDKGCIEATTIILEAAEPK